MGIRDALRAIRGSGKNGGAGGSATDDETDVEAPEPTWFQPRHDGSYDTTPADSRAADSGAADSGAADSRAADSRAADSRAAEQSSPTVRLRFLPGGKVFETKGGGDPRAGQQSPCRGEYTGAGRFNVQRQFERIVSYAVLEMEQSPTDGRPGFIARRTDAADRSTWELHFSFRPDVTG